MWLNISKKNVSFPPHTHSNNIFSGVWYPFEDISKRVRENTEPQKDEQESQSQKDSLHLSDAVDGEDIPVGE